MRALPCRIRQHLEVIKGIVTTALSSASTANHVSKSCFRASTTSKSCNGLVCIRVDCTVFPGNTEHTCNVAVRLTFGSYQRNIA